MSSAVFALGVVLLAAVGAVVLVAVVTDGLHHLMTKHCSACGLPMSRAEGFRFVGPRGLSGLVRRRTWWLCTNGCVKEALSGWFG